MPSPPPRSHKSISQRTISSPALPKGWPQDVTYLSSPRYSKSLQQNLLHVDKTSKEARTVPVIAWKAQRPSPLVRIKPISRPSHPANGQQGLFATQHLPPGTFIIPYLGFVHGAIDADPSSDYDLGLSSELGIAVDASRMGNEARFINDYRGVSATGPNAEFRDMLLGLDDGMLERCMGLFVLSGGKVKSAKRAKGIEKGEEILVSYGKGFWNGRKGNEALRSVEDVK